MVLEPIFVALRALIGGTARREPNRAHAVDIAVTITWARAQQWRRLMENPNAIQWLEKETGQSSPRSAKSSGTKAVSATCP